MDCSFECYRGSLGRPSTECNSRDPSCVLPSDDPSTTYRAISASPPLTCHHRSECVTPRRSDGGDHDGGVAAAQDGRWPPTPFASDCVWPRRMSSKAALRTPQPSTVKRTLRQRLNEELDDINHQWRRRVFTPSCHTVRLFGKWRDDGGLPLSAGLADDLYLGAFPTREMMRELEQQGITHIINCCASQRRRLSSSRASCLLGSLSGEDGFRRRAQLSSESALDATPRAAHPERSPSPTAPPEFLYVFIDAKDHEDYLVLHHHQEEFERAMREVQQAGGKAFVHCMAGVNRSVALVAAHLMHRWNMGPLDVVRHFRRCGRMVLLENVGFRAQLVDYFLSLHPELEEES